MNDACGIHEIREWLETDEPNLQIMATDADKKAIKAIVYRRTIAEVLHMYVLELLWPVANFHKTDRSIDIIKIKQTRARVCVRAHARAHTQEHVAFVAFLQESKQGMQGRHGGQSD